MSKRYYWLKLKEDFFGNKEIKKLRKIAGGDTYTIIYLKMQLFSIKSNGIITFDGTEKDIFEQLSIELDEDLDNVKVTINYLFSNNLIEQSDHEFLLNKVPESIGNETTSAERVRKFREKNKQKALQCNIGVTTSNKNVTLEIRDKRIEIEKELKQKHVRTKDVSTDHFKAFWDAYPKKIAKAKALKVFAKLKVTDSLLATMLGSLKVAKQSNQWQTDNGRYIPHPATWLNQRRWEDEVAITTSKPQKLMERMKDW